MTSQPNERVFRGRPAAPGFAVGRAWRLAEGGGAVARVAGPPEAEQAAFDRGLRLAAEQLTQLSAASDGLGADILEFQLALLDDDDLIDPVRKRIAAGVAADEAWIARLDEEIDGYLVANDEHMAARAADLRDVRDRVLRAIAGSDEVATIPDGSILIADDLTPSTFLGLDWSRLGGAVLTGGSATSHVSILARSRGVPMLVEVQPEPDAACGEPIAIDATGGVLFVCPGAATLAGLEASRAADARIAAEALAVERLPAVTADGRSIKVLVNVNAPGDLDGLSPAICDGIGLTRTEFLFAHGAPDEATQLAVYGRILAWAGGRPVTIRTLDAGGDKPVPGITIDGESNPFLGTRGLRLSLKRPHIFRVQLKALARAAAAGPLRIMVPMVTVPEEMEAARRLLDETVDELQRQGIAHARPPLGMMVEVPAAALMAEQFATDFYSIGSNDLGQYVTAVARDISGLSHLTREPNPAVLELIGRTVAAGRRRGVPVSLCGDMASRPELTGALLDTGLDTLSVAPASVGRVKLAVARAVSGPRP